MAPSSMLQLGGAPRWVVADLVSADRYALGVDDDPAVVRSGRSLHPAMTFAHASPLSIQLERRFDLVLSGSTAVADDGHRRGVIHACVQHCAPGGHVAIVDATGNGARGFANDFDLTLIDDLTIDEIGMSIYRRSGRFTVHDLLFEARATINRITAATLFERLRSDDPPLVLDVRTPTDRDRFGIIEPSAHVPRTVLEWQLDPANGYRHPAVRSFEQPLVVVCNGGYSSSLAAANLVRLGYTDVADLIGGFHAWSDAALPSAWPDHTHLGY
jgi:rhodanese-related sulfurtransferase